MKSPRIKRPKHNAYEKMPCHDPEGSPIPLRRGGAQTQVPPGQSPPAQNDDLDRRQQAEGLNGEEDDDERLSGNTGSTQERLQRTCQDRTETCRPE